MRETYHLPINECHGQANSCDIIMVVVVAAANIMNAYVPDTILNALLVLTHNNLIK